MCMRDDEIAKHQVFIYSFNRLELCHASGLLKKSTNVNWNQTSLDCAQIACDP